jgi:signal transduction histidine kinase
MPVQELTVLHRRAGFWLLPGIAVLFLLAALTLLFVLQGREQQIQAAERDDALWAAYQLDRENLKFAAQLSQYQLTPQGHDWHDVELRFEILYSRITLLQQGQFARVFGAANLTAERSFWAIQLMEAMDQLFESDQATQPEGMEQLLALSLQLQQTTEPLIAHMKGISAQLNTESREQLRQLYRYLILLVILLTLTMSLIIGLLIRKMQEARTAQQQAQKMAAELEQTARQAEAASRAKSDFLATLSHEIRTPMNGVMGLADLLRETPQTTEQRRFTDAIFNSARSLMQLLNDLLDISRLEAGKLLLDDQDVHLSPFLQEVMDFFAAGMNQKPVHLSWSLAPEADACYHTDPVRLRQVLLNLIGNALKFTEQGQVQLEVTQNKDGLHFSVQDTGPGIPLKVQEQLFEVFTQADSSISRRYGGTGLGLAISKQIVERMGGSIQVKSQPGAGSCFSFTLPLQPLSPHQ